MAICLGIHHVCITLVGMGCLLEITEKSTQSSVPYLAPFGKPSQSSQGLCFHFSFSRYGSNSHLDGLEFVLGLPFVQRHKPEETAMLLLSQLERELGELHLHYLCKDFSGKNVWMQTCSDSIEIRTFENHAYKLQYRNCWYCAAGCAPRDAKNV